jgi:hypothetical protein
MNAVVAAIQPVLDGNGAHAALTPFSLDAACEVTPGTEKQLTAALQIAGAGTAMLHTNAFIFWAIFNEHHFTRPYINLY